MNTFWLLDNCYSNKERVANAYTLPGQTDEAREVSILGSVAEEPPVTKFQDSQGSETQYEPEASGSGGTMPTRRLSYSAMHVCQSSC